jgi:hypothetical protein
LTSASDRDSIAVEATLKMAGGNPMRDARWIDVLATIAAIVGGILLLQFTSAGTNGYSFTGRNIFETLSHGVGLYLIAKGLFIARATDLATNERDETRKNTQAVRELIEVVRQTGSGFRE